MTETTPHHVYPDGCDLDHETNICPRCGRAKENIGEFIDGDLTMTCDKCEHQWKICNFEAEFLRLSDRLGPFSTFAYDAIDSSPF